VSEPTPGPDYGPDPVDELDDAPVTDPEPFEAESSAHSPEGVV
jgi:hypothetical protein